MIPSRIYHSSTIESVLPTISHHNLVEEPVAGALIQSVVPNLYYKCNICIICIICI